jgi:hypothetical protein
LFKDGKNLNDKNIIIQHNLNETRHSAKFSSLEFTTVYKVCTAVSGINPKMKCTAENEKDPRFTCKNVRTECHPLPNATKLPVQVPWNPNEDFNPFTSIKVMMEAGTFDGAKSGLSKFSIR